MESMAACYYIFIYLVCVKSFDYYINPIVDSDWSPLSIWSERSMQRQSEEFKKQALDEAKNDWKKPEFFGCYLTQQRLDYGPSIIADHFYTRSLCAIDCKIKFVDHCSHDRTLVGIASATGCICICDWIDVFTAKKLLPQVCGLVEDDGATEFGLVMGTRRVTFRVMSVCQMRKWGHECNKTCNCQFPICDRNTGQCDKQGCLPPYYGKQCNMLDPCKEHSCQHASTCERISNEKFKCHCTNQTYGSLCEYIYDYAVHQGSEVLKVEDFDLQADDIQNAHLPSSLLNAKEASYVGCFKRINFTRVDFYTYRPFPLNCVDACRRKKLSFLHFSNEEECFCGELDGLKLTLNKSESDKRSAVLTADESEVCEACPKNADFKCSSRHTFALYTSCPFTYYLYSQKCQNRCYCINNLACNIKNGRCPSGLCSKGLTGERCNIPLYQTELYKNVEEVDKEQLSHFSSIFSLVFVSFAIFACFWTTKTYYSFIHLNSINLEMHDHEKTNLL